MKNLFAVSVADVQHLAEIKTGRKLTIEELERIGKGLEFGLECWEDVANTAIDEVVS